MKGQWVYAVAGFFKGTGQLVGYNSCYADLKMAERKAERMQKDMDRYKNPTQMRITKMMYFKGVAEENSFDDRCSICGGQLEKNEGLTETHASSVDKK